MVRGRLRQLPILIALAVTGAACRTGGLARDGAAPGPPPDVPLRAFVDIGDGAVAARLQHGTVSLVMRTTDGTGVINAHRVGGGRRDSAHLLSFDGPSGSDWNSFLYGTARPGVDRVEVLGMAGRGGQVIDGAWVIAFRERDLAPDDLSWRFLGPGGEVLLEGRGILAPQA